MSSRRGATLVELLVVLALLAVLLGLAAPRAVHLRDGLAAWHAAEALREAIRLQRAFARAQRRVTVLELGGAAWRIVLEGDSTALWTHGAADPHVSWSGRPARLRAAPDGLLLGAANATVVVRRGAAERRVVIAKYGRVRLE